MKHLIFLFSLLAAPSLAAEWQPKEVVKSYAITGATPIQLYESMAKMARSSARAAAPLLSPMGFEVAAKLSAGRVGLCAEVRPALFDHHLFPAQAEGEADRRSRPPLAAVFRWHCRP